ncbi:hypothetical protein COCNU_scaffold001820G000010 [Cocos nucifera]|nr:hypothetical protein [Cocos nucifera]
MPMHEGIFGIPLQGGEEEPSFWAWQTFTGEAKEIEGRFSPSSEKHTAVTPTHPSPIKAIPMPAIEVLANDDVVVIEAPTNAVQTLPVQPHAPNGERCAPDGEGPSRVEADKGKAMEPPAFTVEYDPNTSSKEATVMVGMRIKVIDQVLQDRRLAEELMRMVMLPTNWEVSHNGYDYVKSSLKRSKSNLSKKMLSLRSSTIADVRILPRIDYSRLIIVV